MPVNYGSQIDEHHAVRRDAGMFDVSHMRVVDLEGAGARDFLRYALANNVDKLKMPGKALYSCLLRRRRRRARRPDRLFPARGFLPPRRQRRHRRQGHRVARARCSRERAPRLTLTPRDDLAMIAVQGPQARAQGLAGAARQRGGDRGARSRSTRASPTAAASTSSRAPATPARTASRSLLPATRAARLWHALAAAGVQAVRPRRARHAAPRGRHESLRPGHGRDGHRRSKSGLAWTVDLASAARLRRQGGAARAAAARAARRASLLLDAGGVLRAHQQVRHRARRRRDHQRHVLARRCSKSIALARVPRRRRAGRHASTSRCATSSSPRAW